jgi:elongation factor G
MPSIEDGLNSAIAEGVIAGFPVLDIKITLVGAAHHPSDSTAAAFEIAARAALREGLLKAGSVLLEPMMKVEVATPEEYLGGVIGNLHDRQGLVVGTGASGNAQLVQALVPLANLFGYADDLRSLSKGQATYSLQFDHYSQVPWSDDDPPFRPAIGMRP